eukprot:3206960-Lingulodinium_polyedra.AAC.1
MRSNRPLAAAAASKSRALLTPCEHQFLAFAWCLRRARLASRCGGGRSIRPHLCATFDKRCTKMRSNR